jgi:lipopolysaccharide/colanic/teichoic acid biosynthesis glycosyltransferase
VLSPVVALVLIVYALDLLLQRRDHGPLLYREPRVSQGRTFGLLKFRTLRADVLARSRRATRARSRPIPRTSPGSAGGF